MDGNPKTKATPAPDVAQLRRRIANLEAEIAQRDATLAENKVRYRSLFNKTPSAIFIADIETGILVDANVAAEKLIQKPRAEIIGMHFTKLHVPESKERVEATFKEATQTLDSNDIKHISGTVLRADGVRLPVEIAIQTTDIDGKRHLMGVFHDVSERKAMENALRMSEQMFRGIVEEAADGIMIVNEAGVVIGWNDALERITHRKRAEVLGKKAVDVQFSFFPPDRQTSELYRQLTENTSQILTTGIYPTAKEDHQYRISRESDETIVEETAFTVKTNKGYMLIGFSKDVTEKVKLQTQNRVLSEAVEQSKNAIIITDKEGEIKYVNTGFEAITGFTRTEALGKTPRILKSQLQTPEYYEKLWATISAGRVFNDYIRNKKKDGTIYTEDKTITPLRDEHGNITHFVSVGREVSKITEVQEALIKSRTRYKMATTAGKVGVWDWKFNDGTFYIDPQLKAMFGYGDAEISPKIESWMTLIHPDDLAMAAQAMQQYIDNEETEYEITHRKIAKDGTIYWFLSRGVGLRDENGIMYRMIGTDTDITELVETRQAEKDQRLQAETMQEVALALISHTDMNDVLDEILRQAKRLVNYTTANIALFSGEQLSIARAVGYEKYGSTDFLNNLSYDIAGHAVHTDVVQTKKALVLKNTHQNSIWRVFEATAWIKSYLGIPIILHDKVIGVLQLDSDEVGAFTQEDADRLRPLANAAAIALENARLYEQAHKDAETNQVLLREVNHRVKNNLAALIGLLYFEKRAKPEFAETMENVINRVRSMATVHQMLSATKWEPILLSRLVEQIVRNISEAQSSERYLSVQIEPSTVLVTATQANNIALVINELATNVVKHAHLPESDATPQIMRINVYIRENGENIIVEFKDNGIGFPDSVLDARKVNVGLELVENMVKGSLLGKISLFNNKGAVALMEFPMAVNQ